MAQLREGLIRSSVRATFFYHQCLRPSVNVCCVFIGLDLDSIVVTVPSKYAPRQLTSGASSPFVSQSPSSSSTGPSGSGSSPTSGTTGGSGTNTPNTSGAPSSLLIMGNPLMLLILSVVLILRPWSGGSSRSRR